MRLFWLSLLLAAAALHGPGPAMAVAVYRHGLNNVPGTIAAPLIGRSLADDATVDDGGDGDDNVDDTLLVDDESSESSPTPDPTEMPSPQPTSRSGTSEFAGYMIAAAVVGLCAALLLAYVVYSLVSKMALRGHLRGTNINGHHWNVKSPHSDPLYVSPGQKNSSSRVADSLSAAAVVPESAPLIPAGHGYRS